MLRNHSRRNQRGAFTLVEMVVVLLIIAILASLVVSVTVNVTNQMTQAQTRTEISQLEVALRAFMSDYGLSDPPPSYLILNETSPLSTPSAAFLQKVFGKNLGAQGPVDWNGDGVLNGPWALEGEQCLVFYLGGIPTTPGLGGFSPQGFSTNNMNPAMPGGKRKGPYYTFQVARLVPLTSYNPAASPFPMYIDAWQVKLSKNLVGPMPYAYFSSNGNNNIGYQQNNAPFGVPQDCQSIKAYPYFITGATPTQYTNPNGYQILSAGKDGVFGAAGWIPGSGVPPVPPSNPNAAGQPAGADDQANFSSTLLGQGQN
jgi:prepilin-type N-terminal cleavage/methylation domain-containing protein